MKGRCAAAGSGFGLAACLLVAGAAILPAAAAAQRPAGGPMPLSVGIGLSYEAYSFANPTASGIRSVSLLTVPFAAGTSVTNGLEAGVSGAFAYGHLVRSDQSTTSLSGLTDTQLSLSFQTPGGGLRVTAMGVLPTGQARQTTDQADLAGIVAADVLPFRITNWGTGGGAGGSVALARSLGETNIGASVGYIMAAQFRPISGVPYYYRPGSQLHVRAAVDHTYGVAGKLSAVVSYQHFANDRYAGANLYHSGDRLMGTVSYAFAMGARSSGLVYGGVLHRQHGSSLTGAGVEAAQTLGLFGGALRIPAGAAVIQPRVDVRALGRAGGGGGYVAGAGASVAWTSGGVTIAPMLMGRFGNAKVFGGESSGITGLDIGLGLRFGGGQ